MKAEFIKQAIDMCSRAREEQILELVRSGSNGGTGRAMNISPTINQLTTTIQLLTGMLPAEKESVEKTDDRMAAVRAAKTK